MSHYTIKKHGNLYRVWSSMRSRCTNPSHPAWQNYGGRGIGVCREWDSFLAFRDWASMAGYAPGLDLDRHENDLGYCPENCRFVTRQQNLNNTRGNLVLSAFGEEKTLAEWTSDPRCRAKYKTVWMRVQTYGEDAESAMSRPSQRQSVEAFGESKLLAEWARDPRCVVPEKTLRQRFARKRCAPETAITAVDLRK